MNTALVRTGQALWAPGGTGLLTAGTTFEKVLKPGKHRLQMCLTARTVVFAFV